MSVKPCGETESTNRFREDHVVCRDDLERRLGIRDLGLELRGGSIDGVPLVSADNHNTTLVQRSKCEAFNTSYRRHYTQT